MQGRLFRQTLEVEITTHCAHCAQPMKLTVDSELRARVDGDAEPLVFEPNVDWTGFAEANIIRAY